MILEDDTVVLLSTSFRVRPPSSGGIAGGNPALGLVGSGGAMQRAVVNPSPELGGTVGEGWREGKSVGVGNTKN